MACKSCAEKKAARKREAENHKSYGIIDYAKAKLSGKIDETTAQIRLAVCKTCIHRDQDTGKRLFREKDGKFYCGEPRVLGSLYRDDARVGCGCDLEEKCSYVESKCPRRLWGPGNKLSSNIKVIKQVSRETLKGVIDLVGNIGAGIGDVMIQGSIINGLKAKYPNHSIRAIVKSESMHDWLKLIVDDVVLFNDPNYNTGEYTYFTQHEGFEHEDLAAYNKGWNRHQQFAYHSLVEPLPVNLRQSEDGLLKAQERLKEPLVSGKPIVFMAPFATSPTRNWPLPYWVELCTQLQQDGYWVGIVDAINGEERTKIFPCMRYWGLSPNEIIGMFKYAKMIISNDSGMAHVGGSMGLPTIALCGPNIGEVVYGFYKSVKVLQANKNCSTCNFMSSRGNRYSCQAGCEALYDLKPSVVMNAITYQ